MLVMTTPDIRTLKTDMLTYREYPKPLEKAVEDMVRAWRAFYALPEELKVEFGYTPDERFSGAGYELKKGDNEKFDVKENFHVRFDKREFLYGEAARIGEPVMKEFLDASMAVYAHLHPLILDFANAVEEEYRVQGFARDVVALQDSLIIRLLHYFGGRKPGDIFGKPHTDKGGFTGHLHESHPGVERLTDDGRWVSMDVSRGESAFFAGLGLQHRSRCGLKAVWHRIVATEETARDGRDSAVCFSNIANNRYFDKERVGHTQGLPLGSTYTMPFDEFDRLFMD